MKRDDLLEQLEYDVMNRMCQCVHASHQGEPCGEEGVRFTVDSGTKDPEDWCFSYVCGPCSAAGHGPILVYDHEAAYLRGQVATADSPRREDVPEDW